MKTKKKEKKILFLSHLLFSHYTYSYPKKYTLTKKNYKTIFFNFFLILKFFSFIQKKCMSFL